MRTGIKEWARLTVWDSVRVARAQFRLAGAVGHLVAVIPPFSLHALRLTLTQRSVRSGQNLT